MSNLESSGASGDPWEPADRSDRHLLIRLGAAILADWDRLPRERQQAIFDYAVADGARIDLPRLRRQLALVLHAHHTRTSRPRDAQSLDFAAFPPAGPHARPELTNPDATPGSGLFSKPRQRGRGVDPGGG